MVQVDEVSVVAWRKKQEVAWQKANEAWAKARQRSPVKKKCRPCSEEWAKFYSNVTVAPPLFPLDYEDGCPVCGSKMVNTGLCI